MILIAHIFLAMVVLGLGVYFKRNQPGSINNLFGYRSDLSMKNGDIWKEANHFSTDLQLKVAILFLAVEAASYISVGGINSFYISCFFLTIASIAVIPITEIYLRRKFDKEGKRL